MFSYLNNNLFPETGVLFNRNTKTNVDAPYTYSGPYNFNYRTVQQSGALTQPMAGLRRDDQMGLMIELQAGDLSFKPGDIIRVIKYNEELEFTIRSVNQIIDSRNNEQYLNTTRSWPGLMTDNMIYSILLSTT